MKTDLPPELAGIAAKLPWLHTYVLDENEQPVKADMITSAMFMDDDHRRVALDQVGSVEISTVFLGLDTSLGRGKYPLLWETALMTEQSTCPVERYSSATAAREGHIRIVAEQKKKNV